MQCRKTTPEHTSRHRLARRAPARLWQKARLRWHRSTMQAPPAALGRGTLPTIALDHRCGASRLTRACKEPMTRSLDPMARGNDAAALERTMASGGTTVDVANTRPSAAPAEPQRGARADAGRTPRRHRRAGKALAEPSPPASTKSSAALRGARLCGYQARPLPLLAAPRGPRRYGGDVATGDNGLVRASRGARNRDVAKRRTAWVRWRRHTGRFPVGAIQFAC